MARLGDYIEQIRGVSYKPEDICASTDADAVAILRANNIQDDGLVFDDLVYVRKNKVSAKQYIQKGDIVVCASSGSKNLVGKAAIAKENLSVSFGAFCKVVRPKKLIPDYVGHFFQSPKYRNTILELAGGANINNIRNEHIDELDIEIADENIQNKVVEELNQISNLISLRKQQLSKLDELVKSRFIEMFGDVTSNPHSYPIKNFDEISTLITDGEHATPRRTDRGIYLLSARNVLNHAIQLDDVDYIDEDEYKRIARRVIPQAGDVLISCSGSIGRCCVVPDGLKFQMVRSAALIRFDKTINPVFAEWLITSDDLQQQIAQSATQSSQANLFQGKIRKLHGYLPPMEFQEQFVALVEQVEKSKLEIQKSLKKLETLKKALMQKYFG